MACSPPVRWRARLTSLALALAPLVMLAALWAAWRNQAAVLPAAGWTSVVWLLAWSVHWWAHALAARVLGVALLRPWRWTALGEVGHLSPLHRSLRGIGEALAGPLSSLLVAMGSILVAQLGIPPMCRKSMEMLALANGLVGVLNIFPALGLDGGQIFLLLSTLLRGDLADQPLAQGTFAHRLRTLAIAGLWFMASLILVERGGFSALAGLWLAWSALALWRIYPLAALQGAVASFGWDLPAGLVAARAMQLPANIDPEWRIPSGVRYLICSDDRQVTAVLRVPTEHRLPQATIQDCERLTRSQWIYLSPTCSVAEVLMALWDTRALAALLVRDDGWAVLDQEAIERLSQFQVRSGALEQHSADWSTPRTL